MKKYCYTNPPMPTTSIFVILAYLTSLVYFILLLRVFLGI